MNPHSILLVDDEESILHTLSFNLKKRGYRVEVAKSGEEALQILSDYSADLVITDLMMEGIGGIDVLRKVKELDPKAMVIVLTGYATLASATDALRLGAFDYLQKPCGREEFLHRVSNCLERQELSRELEIKTLELMSANTRLMDEIGMRKRAEEVLLDHQKNLSQKVEERTLELKLAKEKAEEAVKAKMEFLSKISHELRTPLNAILGFTQLMLMQWDTQDQRGKERIEYIYQAGKSLLHLVNEVLGLNRLEFEPLELNVEKVSLAKAVRAVLDLIQPLAEKHEVVIVDDLDPSETFMVETDPLRLGQAALNIIRNAIEFNRKGGKVRLYSEIIDDGGFVRLNVEDSGCGIAEKDREKVFEPLERIALDDMAKSGAGVSLAITKRLVQILGGSIGFTSQPEEGTTFYIDLPLTR